jgi:hypothetical protein
MKEIKIVKSVFHLPVCIFHYSNDENCFIPLRAEQVSKVNLRSKQGGIHFIPFVLIQKKNN